MISSENRFTHTPRVHTHDSEYILTTGTVTNPPLIYCTWHLELTGWAPNMFTSDVPSKFSHPGNQLQQTFTNILEKKREANLGITHFSRQLFIDPALFSMQTVLIQCLSWQFAVFISRFTAIPLRFTESNKICYQSLFLHIMLKGHFGAPEFPNFTDIFNHQPYFHDLHFFEAFLTRKE